MGVLFGFFGGGFFFVWLGFWLVVWGFLVGLLGSAPEQRAKPDICVSQCV